MNRWRNYLFLTLCVLGLLLLPAFGQKTTGLISGVVTDPTGAVVANATVTVTNIGTGQTRTASTDTSGTYTVPDLAPGMYQVAVKSTSFKEALAKDVEVHVATTTTLNVAMQMGGATETVEVTTNVVQVQTDSAVLGETIDATQVKELPLNGRNFMGLTQLAPGVSFGNSYSSKDKGLAGGVDFAVNGNSVTNNLYLIDGANNNDVGSNRTILIYPSVDSIAEFKMLQNSYGPEYGQASGAVITMVTKSGTNAFHGDVFYAGRNDALSAWQWNAKKAAVGDPNARKGMLRRNDFGFAIGGPVIKDRIFFFYNQEWNKETRGVHYEACVPTAAERIGDFSQGFGTDGLDQCGATRPTIPAALAKGTTGGDQYIIANPTLAGQLLAARYPLPNLANPVAGTNHNWSASQNSKLPWDEINGRMDINITKNNVLMGRFVRDHWNNPAKGTTGWGDDAFPALNSNWTQPSKMIVGKLTSTIGSSIVNDAEFAYSNNRIDVSVGGTGATVAGTAYTATELLQAITDAFPPVYAENLKNAHMSIPNPGWGGFDPYGIGSTGPEYGIQAPWNNKLDLYSIRDDISWVKGNHTYKAGFLFGWNGKNEDNGSPQSERPGFGAGSPLPLIDPETGDSIPTTTNNPLANIMLPGLLYNLNENSVNTRVQLRWRDYEFYVGDTWKARKNLTLEYGVRYSLLFTPFQPNNQFTSFNPAAYNPNGAAGDPCNGLWVIGDPCGQANSTFGTSFSSGTKSPYGKYLQPQNYHLFAPRLGISWDPWGDGNWAFRAGVGQFFQRERVSSYFIYANNAPFSVNGNFARTLDGATPSTPPAGSVSPNGGRVASTNVPNSWQWNMSVEHSFAKDTALQISYVGNAAIHQTNSYDLNVPDPNDVTCNLATGSYTASAWACGAFNVGGAPVFNTYRPFSQFGQLTYWDANGHATYHSFQTVFKTKYKRSQLTAAYTWSHSIGNVVLDDSSGSAGDQSYLYYKNPGIDRGNTNINRPHIFITNFTFFLPEMKGYNGFVRNTIGGWELTGITTAQSGHSNTAQLGGGNLPENTNLLVDPDTHNGLAGPLGLGLRNGIRPFATGSSCNDGMKGNQIYNVDAFKFVGYHIGELPTSGLASRGYCLGPRFVNTDFSLNKNFKLTERIGMQFRLDFFDLFNHANFSGNSPGMPVKDVNCGPADVNGLYQPCSPTNNVISRETKQTGWGQAGSTIGNAGREVQYGLKITF